MSALLTETTRALARSGDADRARTTVGIVVVAVLLVVLVVREMARAKPGGERARRVQDLRFVTVPLITLFIAIVAPRVMELLK